MVTLGVTAPLFGKFGGRLFSWIGFFAATALKLINAPLGLVYLALQRNNWQKTLGVMFMAGAIVWLLPLLYFRSSLLVMWVYHQNRGLQVESMPARLADTINRYTKSERYTEKYKNYEIEGPVSKQVKKVFDVLFPLAILVYIVWLVYLAWKLPPGYNYGFGLYATLGYFFLFMATGKVLSTPFFLWHIPLAAMLPTKGLKQKMLYLLPSLLLVSLNMTFIPNLEVGIFLLHIFRSWVNAVLLLWLMAITVYDLSHRHYQKVNLSI